MMFFISEAFADAAPVAGPGGLVSFLPMIAFIGILYFLLIRPQQKRAKQHQAMMIGLKKADKVVTVGGIIATVAKILNDNEVVLEIAEGVFCKFLKSSITNIISGQSSVGVDHPEKIASQPAKDAEPKSPHDVDKTNADR